MIKRSKKTLKTSRSAVFGGGGTLLSRNDRVWGTTQHSRKEKWGFTLAEVLITLGIIGVVAALTLPALLTNIQSKVRAERSRSVQYKFSLATEKMARLNLIGPYDSTDAFVDELQKHLNQNLQKFIFFLTS